jgi:hypothetical protein
VVGKRQKAGGRRQKGRGFNPTQNPCPASVSLAIVLVFLQILSYFLALSQLENHLKALIDKGFGFVQQALFMSNIAT